MPKQSYYKVQIEKSGYYQSILQLRPCTEEIFNFVLNQIKKNKITIGKKVELKNGLDLYLSSNKLTLALGKKLKKSFRGSLKISKKLFTKDRLTGKRVYRVTVCFRLT